MDGSENSQTVLWLVRHPEPAAAVRGRCYGSLDVALSREGVRQAHGIARTLATEHLDAIYTSPRQRCLQAARIIAAARACAVEAVEAFRELDFGEFENRSYEEIAALYPDLYRQWMEHPTNTQFPGGESFQAMSKRVMDATRNLRSQHSGHSLALITHGGAIRIILADALAMEPANIFRIGQHYGALNRIRYFGEVPIVELMNSQAESIANAE